MLTSLTLPSLPYVVVFVWGYFCAYVIWQTDTTVELWVQSWLWRCASVVCNSLLRSIKCQWTISCFIFMLHLFLHGILHIAACMTDEWHFNPIRQTWSKAKRNEYKCTSQVTLKQSTKLCLKTMFLHKISMQYQLSNLVPWNCFASVHYLSKNKWPFNAFIQVVIQTWAFQSSLTTGKNRFNSLFSHWKLWRKYYKSFTLQEKY